MPKIYTYTEGQNLHNLTFVKEIDRRISQPNGIGTRVYSDRTAIFKCHCGKDFISIIQHIKSGHTQSCGCRHSTAQIKHGCAIKKNGKVQKAEYYIWVTMRARCNNYRRQDFYRYGGRGISVCERWTKFAFFLSDMGDRPSNEHSIERVDNNGNYEPSNCKWATRKEQAKNRRSTVYITHNGETHNLTEWTEILGLKRGTIDARHRKRYSTDEMLSPISFKTNKKLTL